MASMGMSAQVKTMQTDKYKNDVREKLALDYSMPDYSTSKINAKVMGPRLAAILKKIQEMKAADTSMGALSVMQAQQIDGMTYCAVKKVKLIKVVKQGNTITIAYDIELKQNAKKIKKVQIVFSFVDGVSDDVATNDFFTNICRYIKENN